MRLQAEKPAQVCCDRVTQSAMSASFHASTADDQKVTTPQSQTITRQGDRCILQPTAILDAPSHIVHAEQVEDVCVGRRLAEVDLHELHRVGVDARHWLADVRQYVIQCVLLTPAQTA